MAPITLPLRGSPLLIPWEEVGANASDFFNQIAVQARDFMCGLHNQDPSGLTGNCQVLDNPLCRLAHSNWDRACQAGQSVPLPLPFQGGQCEVPYRVSLAVNTYIPGNCNQTNPNGVVANRVLQGPLQGWNFFEGQNQAVEGNCFGSTELVQSVSADFLGTGDSWPVFRNFYSTNANFFDGRYCQLLSFSIERVDGLPDDCGDGGIRYSPGTPITEEDKTTTITINNSDGTTFDIDLTLITINNEFDFDLFLGDPNNPSDGGYGVHIDYNGIAFDPGGSGLPGLDDLKKGDDDTGCKPRKPELPDLEEEPGEEEEQDVEFEYLKVTLTSFPNRAAYGRNNQQTNWFAGHVKFNVDGQGYLPPEYIYSEESVFEAPENTNGYVVSFRQGATGTVTKFKVKSEDNTNGNGSV